MGAILQYGLSVTLVGIGTVFVGLIILIALIKLMEKVMNAATGKQKAAAPAPAAAFRTRTRRALSCARSAVSTTRPRGTAPVVKSRFTAACKHCIRQRFILRGGLHHA